ncbi:hypothetical protein GIB67_004302 [Kingdonia uniflora]|uniref:BHLH transcription factor n=1 Tax=Kingdonia uniflora TaxID=39325 RepID=A0A7J7MR93_9MAGN|nr:hypothetical protein GIB67_004302 [Kingdonia uniflora]
MKNNSYNSDSTKLDRKTIEENRRILMKSLCFKLSSVIAKDNDHHCHDSSKYQEGLSLINQLDQAVDYINMLHGRIEKLKRKNQLVKGIEGTSSNVPIVSNALTGLRLPVLELREMGSTLEVILINGVSENLLFYRVISVLEEEGAEVGNASFSIVGDKVFHTFHSQVIKSSVEVEMLRRRLNELVY